MIRLLDAQLHTAVLDTFEAEFGQRPADAQIQIQSTRAEFDGDRTLVVFPLAGLAGAPPHVAAERLGEALTTRYDWIDSFGVVKGFLNLTLSNVSWSDALKDTVDNPHWVCNTWLQTTSHGGVQLTQHQQAPSLGALEEQLLGYSVSRILEAAGHDVVKVQIINDRGIHICKVDGGMAAIRQWRNPSIDW